MFLFRRPNKPHIEKDPSVGLRIVPYAPQHREDLLALIRTRFAETGSPLYLEDRDKDLVNPDTYWREPGGEFMVLTFKGHVIGSLAVRPLKEKGRVEFDWFYMNPEFEGKGYSAPLYRWALDWCISHNVEYVELWSIESRTRAHHLYRRIGFIDKGIRQLLLKNPNVYILYFELQVTEQQIERLKDKFNKLP